MTSKHIWDVDQFIQHGLSNPNEDETWEDFARRLQKRLEIGIDLPEQCARHLLKTAPIRMVDVQDPIMPGYRRPEVFINHEWVSLGSTDELDDVAVGYPAFICPKPRDAYTVQGVRRYYLRGDIWGLRYVPGKRASIITAATDG